MLREEGHLLVTASMSERKVPGNPAQATSVLVRIGKHAPILHGFLEPSSYQTPDSDSQSRALNTKIRGQCLLTSPAFLMLELSRDTALKK